MHLRRMWVLLGIGPIGLQCGSVPVFPIDLLSSSFLICLSSMDVPQLV